MVTPTLSEVVPVAGEKRVTLHNLDWQAYQQIRQALEERSVARLTYNCGSLEIVMPLEIHEFSARMIELFIRVLVVEFGLRIKTLGSTTLNREDLDRGAQPDNGYYIQNYSVMAGRTVNLAQDPPPDLVVEVDITHTDIDKDRLYAAMGVPEFWRFDGTVLKIQVLRGLEYQEVDTSPTFPRVDMRAFYQFLELAKQDEVAAELGLRETIQKLQKENR